MNTENIQKPKTDTIGYLNVIRVVAILAVVIGHVIMPINVNYRFALTDHEFHFGVFFKSIFEWCVPLFVMISGVIFLDTKKEITIEKLLKKYFLRIILALFVFGIPYAFIEILYDAHYQFKISQIGTAILNVVQGKLWSHMWYMYMIAGLYLILPLLKLFVSFCEKKMLEYLLIVLFIFVSIIPFTEILFSVKINFYLPLNSIYVFYFLLGYYIHNYNVSINFKILFLILILFLITVSLLPLNKNLIDMTDGGGITLINYNSPIVVICTYAIFCIFHQTNASGRIFDVLSPMCFGIYLIHPLFTNFLYKVIKITPEKYPLAVVIVVVLIITLILSVCFTYIARKITILRKYIL